MKRQKPTQPEPSRLRQELFALLDEARALLEDLARPGPMIAGSFYGMYKKCGRPNCRCADGQQLHGPFPVVSLARKGRRSTRSVPRDRVDYVQSRAETYRRFQDRLTRLRQSLDRIVEIVKQIRDAHLEEWP